MKKVEYDFDISRGFNKLKTQWKRHRRTPVYENRNGDRIHMANLVKVKGEVQYIYDSQIYQLLKVFGHNKRRCLMFLVEQLTGNFSEEKKE